MTGKIIRGRVPNYTAPYMGHRSGRLGNYGYLLAARTLSPPLMGDDFISELAGLKRLSPGIAEEITPLPIAGEGYGRSEEEAHDDMAEQMEDWIRTQSDFEDSQ